MQMFHNLPAFIGTKVIGGEMCCKESFEYKKQHNFDGCIPDGNSLPDVITPGYHVVYSNPDGSIYHSWSPQDVFESSYRSLDNGLTFGDALFFLKQGKKVARSGWNGKGMWLCLQTVDEHSKMGHNYIYMKGVDGKFFPWNPNNLDMLAEDWCIVNNLSRRGDSRLFTFNSKRESCGVSGRCKTTLIINKSFNNQ